MLTEPETESSETVATGGHGSPTDLVDGKMGRHHSSLSVLLLNVTIPLSKARGRPTRGFSGTRREKPSWP